MSRKYLLSMIFGYLFLLTTLPNALNAQTDTWETLQPTTSPPARMDHTMVAREDGTFYLFGGKDESGNALNDLYRFENNEWVLLEPQGDIPPERFAHAMVISTYLTDVVLIFGGEDDAGAPLNDLYTYSIKENTWTQVLPNNDAPPARRDCVYWYSDYAHAFYILGGYDGNSDLTDFWSFSPVNNMFEQLSEAPGPSTGGSVFPAYNRAYVFDGMTPSVYKYDLDAGAWDTHQPVGTTPAPRQYAAMASSSRRAWLFGGEGSVLDDTWKIFKYFETYANRSTWEQLADMPEPLSHAAAVLLPGRIILFGGMKEDGNVSDQTLVYTPPPGYPVGMELSPAEVTAKVGETVEFTAWGIDEAGGKIELPNPIWMVDKGGVIHSDDGSCTFTATILNNFAVTCKDLNYEFEETGYVSVLPARGDELEEIFLTVSPPARAGHTMAAINNTMYIFGGETGSSSGENLSKSTGSVLGDLWKLEEAQDRYDQQLATNGPSPRTGHTSFVRDGKMYVYGGRDANGQALDDLWVYDPATNTWTEIQLSGVIPAGRFDASSGTTSDDIFWLAGGWTDWGADNQIWSFDFTTNTWQQWADWPGYDPLYGAMMAVFDDKLNVLYGKDIYRYYPGENRWEKKSINPPHAALLKYESMIQYGDWAVMFGGADPNTYKLSKNPYAYNFLNDFMGYLNGFDSEAAMRVAAAATLAPNNDSETLMKAQSSIPQIVIFGGELEDGSYCDRTFIYTPPYELPLAAIEIVPGDINLNVGESIQFVAKGLDTEQMAVSLTPQWSADGGDIDEKGLFTATGTGIFTITATNPEGTISSAATVTVSTSSITSPDGLPKTFHLSQNAPNPFNPETSIRFAVKERCRVILKVYNILGQETTTLIDGDYLPGYHQVIFDARNYATGLYFYHIQMKDYQAVKKMILLE